MQGIHIVVEKAAAAIVDTAEIRASLPCGHPDFESAVTARTDELRQFDSSYSSLLTSKRSQ